MTTQLVNAGITGYGYYVPERIITNDELSNLVDTSDEWIRTRTGIERRHVVSKGVCTSDLGVEAARKALASAGIGPMDVDLIIVATITPDYPFPATACALQNKLGANRAAAFDLSAGCSGFVYGMATGAQFIQTGIYRRVLVVGAEVLSNAVDWEDRNTCVLFGDGAAAVVLEPVQAEFGFRSFVLGADGSGIPLLYQPGGGVCQPITAEGLLNKENTLKMSGRDVFKFAVRIMGEAAKEAIDKAGIGIGDIDYFIPHQANTRIIEAAAKKLELGMDKVFVNVNKYGNTSAASIGIALAEAVEEGKVKRGDSLVLVGFGAGLTWAASVLKWSI